MPSRAGGSRSGPTRGSGGPERKRSVGATRSIVVIGDPRRPLDRRPPLSSAGDGVNVAAAPSRRIRAIRTTRRPSEVPTETVRATPWDAARARRGAARPAGGDRGRRLPPAAPRRRTAPRSCRPQARNRRERRRPGGRCLKTAARRTPAMPPRRHSRTAASPRLRPRIGRVPPRPREARGIRGEGSAGAMPGHRRARAVRISRAWSDGEDPDRRSARSASGPRGSLGSTGRILRGWCAVTPLAARFGCQAPRRLRRAERGHGYGRGRQADPTGRAAAGEPPQAARSRWEFRRARALFRQAQFERLSGNTRIFVARRRLRPGRSAASTPCPFAADGRSCAAGSR